MIVLKNEFIIAFYMQLEVGYRARAQNHARAHMTAVKLSSKNTYRLCAMPPVQGRKSWAEINKERKEQKKKRKQINLEKKVKLQLQEESKNGGTTPESAVVVKELPTITVAVPGSILENAQSAELRTYLAGQIARAACIFRVDEVVVFDDYADAVNAKKSTLQDSEGIKTVRKCCVQLGRILQYLECPQYLRKFFFPLHDDLKYAGLLNPLDAPHHLRQDNDFLFR